MKPLQSSGMLIAVSCYYSCEWVQEICLHDAWQVSQVFKPVHVCACVSYCSRMPSVLQGIGLFPGNWFVQKPGRSSQQWEGNRRPVTLLVISGDKAEKRWDLLCVYAYEKASSPWSILSKRLLSIHAGSTRGWHGIFYWLQSLLPPWFPCAGSGPAMNSGPEAPCVHESSLSHELAVIKAIGKCILCQIHGISVKKKKKAFKQCHVVVAKVMWCGALDLHTRSHCYIALWVFFIF